MNDVLFPVVEEMGRLNEHNFDQSIQSELVITDLREDVAFNTTSSSHTKDVSDLGDSSDIDNGWDNNLLFRIPQNNQWVSLWPDKLRVEIISKDGGMFRLVAGGQLGSQLTTVDDISSYLLFAFMVDGAIIPDSVIGDQDYLDSNQRMERGVSGQIGSFLLDYTIYLQPGNHIIEVAVNNQFLKNYERRLVGGTKIDSYLANTEILVWEMHR